MTFSGPPSSSEKWACAADMRRKTIKRIAQQVPNPQFRKVPRASLDATTAGHAS